MLVGAGPTAACGYVFMHRFVPRSDEPSLRLGMATLLLGLLLHVVFEPLERGAVALLVVRGLEGERVGPWAALSHGWRRLPRVLGARALFLAALLPALALVVPGLVIFASWCVAAPAAALERLGPAAALERSASLTQGRRGALALGLSLIHLVYLLGLAGVFWASDVSAPTTPLQDGLIVAGVVLAGGLAGSLPRVASAVAYHELRARERGAGAGVRVSRA